MEKSTIRITSVLKVEVGTQLKNYNLTESQKSKKMDDRIAQTKCNTGTMPCDTIIKTLLEM